MLRIFYSRHLEFLEYSVFLLDFNITIIYFKILYIACFCILQQTILQNIWQAKGLTKSMWG